MTKLEQVIADSKKLRPSTKTLYRRCVRKFQDFAGREPSCWTSDMVTEWRGHLENEGRKPADINKQLAALKGVSRRYADTAGGSHFAKSVELLTIVEDSHRVAPTPQQVAAVIATCGSDPADIRDRAILVLFARTGMRVSSLCGIRFEDINANHLHVEKKGGKRMTIVLDQEAWTCLSKWTQFMQHKLRITTGHVFRRVSAVSMDDKFTVGDKGMSCWSVWKMVRDRGRRAGVKIHPHLFRHGFVSWQRELGTPDWRIIEVTGHKNLAMLGTYTTDLRANSEPIAAKLPSFLGRRK